MKLTHYNLRIELSDPNNPSVTFALVIERAEREKLVSTPLPLKGTVEAFEEAIEGFAEAASQETPQRSDPVEVRLVGRKKGKR